MHHPLHVIEILFGLQRIVDAVVSRLIQLLVAELRIVPEMRAASRFHQPMSHERAGRHDRIHNAAIDQLRNHQALLGHGHRAGKRHHNEGILVARHGFEHVGRLAELASRKRGVRHRAHQIVDGMDLAQIERLQRNQPISHRIVQFSVDPCAFFMATVLMMAVLRDTFWFQRKPPV